MNKRNWTGTAQMICAAALLLLFGISSYVFVVSAGGSYDRIRQEQEDCSRARVAVNYVLMHIRRFNAADMISVSNSDFGDCLVLSEDIDGEVYETRIYFHEGLLQESFVPAGASYDVESGFEIIEIDSFNVTYENDMIQVRLTSGGEERIVTVKPISAS